MPCFHKDRMVTPVFRTKLTVTLCCFCLCSTFLSIVLSSLETFQVPSSGPESFAFDSNGGGPYTGVSDGRILKYQGPDLGYVDFAYASPNRTKQLCDGTNDPSKGSLCGRALGLEFNRATNELYIADAYHGLCVVGPNGGLATQLLTSIEGKPLKWIDGLDVDQTTGNVYFTVVSTQYNLSQADEYIRSGDTSGGLVEYNPKNKMARVVVRGLKGGSGVGVSQDGSYVLFTEFYDNRISKYWLKGPQANSSHVAWDMISSPGNIKRTQEGHFWIAMNLRVSEDEPVAGTGIRIDETSGQILDLVTFGSPYTNLLISEVNELNGSLYIGTLYDKFGGVFHR